MTEESVPKNTAARDEPTAPDATAPPEREAPPVEVEGPAVAPEVVPVEEPAAVAGGEPAAEPAPAPAPVPVPVPVPVPARSYRNVVGIGSAVYTAVALTLALLVIVPLAPRVFGSTPTDRVMVAARSLAAAPEVRYTGAVLAGMRLDVRAATDGTGLGTIDSDDSGRATLLTVSGTTYTKGDRNWWLSRKAVDTGIYAGHWMTNGQLGFSTSTLLSPKKLAAAIGKGLRRDPVLSSGARGHGVTPVAGAATRLHGTPVDAYRTPSGLTVYVTPDTPYRALAVDGDLKSFGGTDSGMTFALDLGLGTAADRTKVAADVRTASKGLDADKDPAEPADYRPTAAAGQQVNCSETGCGESIEVENSGTGAPKGQGYLLGRFTTDAGQELGTCRAAIPALQPAATARVTCSIATPAWRSWVTGGGGHYRFDSYAFSPGWDGDDPGVVAKLLTFPALRDLDGVWATPVEAAQTLITLLGTKGWTAQKAVDTVRDMIHGGEIGWVHELLASGKFTADPGTLDGNPDSLSEALRRVRGGSGGVAVGSWVGPDSTTYYGSVFDLGAHQVVQLAETSGPETLSALVTTIGGAAGTFGKNAVPAGFGKRVRLLLAPSDPLFRQDQAALRAALRRQGMTADKLSGAALDVVTRYGVVTLQPADFR
jgi:hypothetical protein